RRRGLDARRPREGTVWNGGGRWRRYGVGRGRGGWRARRAGPPPLAPQRPARPETATGTMSIRAPDFPLALNDAVALFQAGKRFSSGGRPMSSRSSHISVTRPPDADGSKIRSFEEISNTEQGPKWR